MFGQNSYLETVKYEVFYQKAQSMVQQNADEILVWHTFYKRHL